ncbi:MAG: YjbQ family protein [Chloroflexi bacterium]|nr:YjbQ family protein [Chloroflexota bacterium]
MKDTLELRTNGKGMIKINSQLDALIHKHGIQEGMCYLFLQHVSCSLSISEGWDPPARADVEEFYERLVPEREPWYEHTIEGDDDSPAHIKATLTQPSLTIPIDNGRANLGAWQGVFLFEHRSHPQKRIIMVRCLKVS